ncbi:MAG: alpha/beta fold hydrolase [Flavobacteriales bacterium]|nr:alpha/beta fold hydrolase [Flavobacteriales bacterium]
MASFSHNSLELSFRTSGIGALPIIAFHGFGRTGEDFSVFENELGAIATIHAFDLPFHGDSPSPTQRANKPFEPAELRDYFIAFTDHIGTKKIALMGYSLGGRMALSLLETMPERISQAILIAPDGLKTKPWYRSLASSAWGRARYRRFIHKPHRVHGIVRSIHKVGLLHEKMHRFILGQSDTHAKRQLLHDVWLSFRHIEPDLDAVASNVRKNKLPVTLVFGAKDNVIKPELADRLQPKAPELISTMILDAGHQLLTRELGGRLRELLTTVATKR